MPFGAGGVQLLLIIIGGSLPLLPLLSRRAQR